MPALQPLLGDGVEPGVGRLLSAPPPWCLAVSRGLPAPPADPRDELRAGERAAIGLAVPLHAGVDGGFAASTALGLNDIRMLDAVEPDGPVVAHLAFCAAVVSVSCPGMPIDTDGWCLPGRATWAAYLAERPQDLATVARSRGEYRRSHEGGAA